MNKKEYFEYILPVVENHFSDLGFIYKKSKGSFVKEIEDGWVRVRFTFYQFALTNNIDFAFEIRKNAVEEIFVQYIKINPANHKDITTIIFSLANLLHDENKSFRFVTKSQLDEIITSKVIPFIKTKLNELTEVYRKLENIYKLYTDDNDKYHNEIYPSYDNYIRTLILGHLVFPNDFETVIKWCEDKLLDLKVKWPNSLDAERYDKDFKKTAIGLSFHEK